jgi:O-antigen/teichoic acid export membrane protein
MMEATDIAKVTTRSGIHFLWGLVASTVISAVGSIFIARLLGSDLYGLYTVTLAAPALLAVFRDWGVTTAMIRSTAQSKAKNRIDEIRSIFVSGYVFEIALGVTLSVISLVFSDLISAIVFNRPNIASLIQITSFVILAEGLTSAATAVFVGTERMELNSFMLIAQSIIKTLIVIALVVFGLGPLGAVIGHVSGAAIAGVFGLLLVWIIYKSLPKPYTVKLQIKTHIATMLQYGIPLSLSSIITAFQFQFYNFLLPIYYTKDNAMIGNYGVAQNFVVLIGFFATPITIMLFPAFSKLNAQENRQTLQTFYQYSVKYASLLVVPVASLVICLSEPAVSTLFGNTYDTAPLFLALLALTYLYTPAGNLSNVNLINSQGQTKDVLLLTLVTAVIGFPMASVLILNFGVLGLIATSLTAVIPSLVIGLRYIQKHYGVIIDWKSSARILLASATAAAVTYAATYQLGYASWIRLIIGTVLFVAALVPTVVFTRAISRSDISNLRELTSGLGPITKLSNCALNILEKIMNMLNL